MSTGRKNSQMAGLCRADDETRFVREILLWGETSWDQSDASLKSASYKDHTDGQTYQHENEVPICSDLTIAPENIKKGVRLTDANVFRIRTTVHGVAQIDWPQLWPYDFMSDGGIRPGRRPLGKGVVIIVEGMGFYPVFRGCVALCGERAGRYTSQVGPRKASRSAPYDGFRVGQLLAMPDDFHGNSALYDLSLFRQNTKGRAVRFLYEPTDRVGLFENGRLTLAPLSAFTGFTPSINGENQLLLTDEQTTELKMHESDALLEEGHDGKPRASTLRPALEHLSSTSGLFKLFRSLYSGTEKSSDTDAAEDVCDQHPPAEESLDDPESNEDCLDLANSVDDSSITSTKVETMESSMQPISWSSSTRSNTPTVSAIMPKAGIDERKRQANDTPTSSPARRAARRNESKRHKANTPTVSSVGLTAGRKIGKARAADIEREDGPAIKHVTEMIRQNSEFLDEKQRETMQDILRLANFSDKIKAARRLITVDPVDTDAALSILRLEADYVQLEKRIQVSSSKESNGIAMRIYLKALSYAKLPADDPARQSMPVKPEMRDYGTSTEEDQPVPEPQPMSQDSWYSFFLSLLV